jgi:hypothetical protein
VGQGSGYESARRKEASRLRFKPPSTSRSGISSARLYRPTFWRTSMSAKIICQSNRPNFRPIIAVLQRCSSRCQRLPIPTGTRNRRRGVHRRERWGRGPVTKAATEKGLEGFAYVAGRRRHVFGEDRGIAKRTQFTRCSYEPPGTDCLIDRINACACRRKSRRCRRRSKASRVNRPCLSAFLLPRGAPEPFAPPCIRHRFFPPTAGDMQGLPERVLAPHRWLVNIGPVLRERLPIAFLLAARRKGLALALLFFNNRHWLLTRIGQRQWFVRELF